MRSTIVRRLTVIACLASGPCYADGASPPAELTLLFDFSSDVAHGPYVLRNGAEACERLSAVDAKSAKWADILEGARSCTSLGAERFKASMGDAVKVIVVYPEGGAKPSIDFSEQSRETALAADLKSLLQIWVGKRFISPPKLTGSVETYHLKKRRANLTISITRDVSAPDLAREAVKAASDSQKRTPDATLQVVTGPPEHWYLSADLPINSVNQVTYDASSSQLVNKTAPSVFYAGVNFRIGDLFTTYEFREFWNDLVIKGLLRVSQNPLDSYGVAIGIRGEFFKRLGIDLAAFSPFVGWTSTLQDGERLPGGEVPRVRSSHFRVGLSFNLDKGVEWVKGVTTPASPSKATK